MVSSREQKKISTFGSRTDIGNVREHNEDSLVVAPPLYVVCDGMGGHAAGEVASEIAVNVIAERAPSHPDAQALAQAVEEANLEIIRAAHEGVGRRGMGTTCTAAMLENERLIIAQVGDSRAYLLHQGRLQQITRDHSLMADLIEAGEITPAEARVHPQRSVITRALGSDPSTQPDIFEINVHTGDRLLICSDGLSSMVDDPDIEAILCRTRDPQRCASQLVNAALAAGGIDNVTVIVVDVTGFAEVRSKKIARKTKITAAIVVLLLAFILGGAFFLFSFLTGNAAYLAANGDYVAIYEGLPGEVLGIDTSKLVRITDVSIDDLQPGLANRLRTEGVTTESVEAAEDLVKEYEQEIALRKQANAQTTTNAAQGSTQTSTAGQSATRQNTSGQATSGQSAGSSSATPTSQTPTQTRGTTR